MGCGPLPDRVKNALFYTIDTLNDNMSLWRWLSTYMQQDMKRATEFDTKAALNLAREHYGEIKLKQRM